MTLKPVRLALVALLLSATPSFAVSKEMIQLQTQIQQLQDAVARLQQSNDERMGVLKDLVQQSADSVNKMSVSIDSLQKLSQTQQEAQGAKVDQVSGQVQSLNDSLDELKARMNRLEKLLQDVKGQQQSISASMQNLPQPNGSAFPATDNTATPAMEAPAPQPIAPVSTGKRGKPSAANASRDIIPIPVPTPASTRTSAPASTDAPPADELYKTALGDYMAAKYTLSGSEFADVVKNYPDNPLSGNASYYLGEIEYRGGHYASAVKDYDRVLEQYPDSNKVPVSHLHKGQALIQLKQNEAGVRELRALIQRYPNSPEAMQARSRLSGMGVPVTPKR